MTVNRHDNRNRSLLASGFWFVDIPRTSSSSIRAELGRHFGPLHGKTNLIEPAHRTHQIFGDHLPASKMRKDLGPALWDQLFTFSVVRNPLDRLWSMFHYRRLYPHLPRAWTFKDYVMRLADAGPETPHFGYSGFRLGMADYLESEQGVLLVDEIVKFEERSPGLAAVGKRIGLPSLGVLSIQAAAPPAVDWRSAYDQEMVELVVERFHRDFELFGYDTNAQVNGQLP